MERSPWKDTRRHSDPAELQPPRYWPGDLVQEIGEPDEIAVVEFSRSDGQICLQWPSGRKEWLHTDVLEFAPGFTPKGRRNPTQESEKQIEEGEIMTIDEQAANLEASYAKYHRQTSQSWRTPEDRREALHTLTSQLREAERTLRLPETGDTASGRSKLILWTELTRATIEERTSQR